MSRLVEYTPAQREIMKRIARGEVISKITRPVKSLAAKFLIARSNGKIYFTTRGYSSWYGGLPKGGELILCEAADQRLKSAMKCFKCDNQ